MRHIPLSLPTSYSVEISNFTRLERLIRELVAQKDYSRVEAVLDQLCNDFAYAVHQPHARNGGLIGLAAAAIALGSVGLTYIPCCDATMRTLQKVMHHKFHAFH